MPQTYPPEFRKKIVRLHMEEGSTYKSIIAEYAYQKPAFPNGAENSAKNARKKPSQHRMPQMKWSS